MQCGLAFGVDCSIVKTSCGQSMWLLSSVGSSDAVDCTIVKTSCGIQSIHAVSLKCGSACGPVECIIVKTTCGI